MFGSDQGPWNHTFRIEHKLGPRLRVVGVIDPDTARAERVLRKKCDSFVKPAYENAVVYSSIDEYYQKQKESGAADPRSVESELVQEERRPAQRRLSARRLPASLARR